LTRTSSKPRTKRDLIIEAWDELGRPGVGEPHLREIQNAIRQSFGAGAVDSPARIARVLADEGAELRHPEVIEFDARWRETRIKHDTKNFGSLEAILAGKPAGEPLGLKQAEVFIKKLERLRNKSERAGDKATWQRARKLAVNARQNAQSLARTGTLDQLTRAEQAEIAAWLAVWIQTPNLFNEWLDLRRRSPEFKRKFLATDKAP
jgi:hypothetical protein